MSSNKIEQKQQEQEDLDEKLRLIRAERYYCQAVAKKALPAERVGICLRNRITIPKEDRVEDVKVWKHKQTQKAFYSGLMVCGSVWTCPVCAAKIAERRRIELKQAFDIHQKEGGRIALLTLTFSHKKIDRLKDILDMFSKATNKFMSGRAFQNIRDEIGMIGRVRALEVTYSNNNGFHPHAHLALFYTNKVDLKVIEDKMYILWDKACVKSGLTVNRKYGLTLENGERANDYIAKQGKWGMDQEITKAHIKKARYGSMTPFDFLREYLVSEDEKYLILFREYAEFFKGKRQIQWSQGLKKRFVLEDKSDEELAKEKIEQADLLGLLDYDIWREILKHNNRSYFLDLVEKYSFEEALSIITTLKKTKKKPSSSQELD